MGRRKIKIARITETRARNVTFQKRKAGVMKKAYELSALCGADVALIVMYEGKAAYFSSLDDVDALLAKFAVHRQSGRPMEVRTNDEFAALCARGHDTHDDGDESEELHLPPVPSVPYTGGFAQGPFSPTHLNATRGFLHDPPAKRARPNSASARRDSIVSLSAAGKPSSSWVPPPDHGTLATAPFHWPSSPRSAPPLPPSAIAHERVGVPESGRPSSSPAAGPMVPVSFVAVPLPPPPVPARPTGPTRPAPVATAATRIAMSGAVPMFSTVPNMSFVLSSIPAPVSTVAIPMTVSTDPARPGTTLPAPLSWPGHAAPPPAVSAPVATPSAIDGGAWTMVATAPTTTAWPPPAATHVAMPAGWEVTTLATMPSSAEVPAGAVLPTPIDLRADPAFIAASHARRASIMSSPSSLMVAIQMPPPSPASATWTAGTPGRTTPPNTPPAVAGHGGDAGWARGRVEGGGN
ncbi:hypothetical protein AMAG_19144 [Allomyces macrogynus ATCC 38327]|uniref:MADS-box domain-containing protein n=1 Tax=Allomyces macrogynus (strain ATCC 38327) TaxID=578462 RepID=A0A0L0SP41_ALLM3|nr:hypothetical protein, variant [Allomyces macrogynus ATCC 38327]KNE64279.1 hypothetical protein AMAG_19144 [Allomyces macrogynus ATCC 38327]|eukprot:KNE64278.1 hypothetical protein, variant [Allomyces macrogynus ATCC 38327]